MIEKAKYLKLKSDVEFLKAKLSEIDSMHDKCVTGIRSLIMVDNKVLEEEKLIEVRTVLGGIITDISSIIIPNINEKI